MALSRFVVTSRVTVAAGAATANPTGGASTPGTAWSELWPVTFVPGQIIYADSSAGSTGPQLLYQAIGSGNLRAFVDGTDTVSRDGISN